VGIAIVVVAVLFLAYSNGANDNFKGVATIYGARVASYRTALAWATLTTLAGALLASTLAPGLSKVFSARGLLPHDVISSTTFMAAAVLGAAITVALATRIGMPVSTTHALTGGLVGAGLIAARGALNLGVLGKSFFLPLLLAPLVAAAIGAVLGGLALLLRAKVPVAAEDCACVGVEECATPALAGAGTASMSSMAATPVLSVGVGTAEACDERFGQGSPRVTAGRAIDGLHFLSAGAVGFARGVNDAPKIMALGLAAGILGGGTTMPLALVAVVMALGGLAGARRVAQTMSTGLSTMDRGSGLASNATAAALVIVGSLYKLPLSTTHVTTGAIVGGGAPRGSVAWRTLGKVALAWITTLPVAIGVSAVVYLVLEAIA
jgi:PiT family inorganic phosphate transporter